MSTGNLKIQLQVQLFPQVISYIFLISSQVGISESGIDEAVQKLIARGYENCF